MEEAVEYFTLEGYKYVDDSPTEWYDPDMFVDSYMIRKQFTKDDTIPNLLVFTAGTELHQDAWYKDGHIVLQVRHSI